MGGWCVGTVFGIDGALSLHHSGFFIGNWVFLKILGPGSVCMCRATTDPWISHSSNGVGWAC